MKTFFVLLLFAAGAVAVRAGRPLPMQLQYIHCPRARGIAASSVMTGMHTFTVYTIVVGRL